MIEERAASVYRVAVYSALGENGNLRTYMPFRSDIPLRRGGPQL